MSTPTVPLPANVLHVAEVVVTDDGIAHRPAGYSLATGHQDRWSDVEGRMMRYVTTTIVYAPNCIESIPSEPVAEPIVHVRCYSAGWANHLGHRGCARCFPEV